MNSINQAIIASVNIQLICIQNNFSINNQVKVIENIQTAIINCHFIHSDNIVFTLISFSYIYADNL